MKTVRLTHLSIEFRRRKKEEEKIGVGDGWETPKANLQLPNTNVDSDTYYTLYITDKYDILVQKANNEKIYRVVVPNFGHPTLTVIYKSFCK